MFNWPVGPSGLVNYGSMDGVVLSPVAQLSQGLPCSDWLVKQHPAWSSWHVLLLLLLYRGDVGDFTDFTVTKSQSLSGLRGVITHAAALVKAESLLNLALQCFNVSLFKISELCQRWINVKNENHSQGCLFTFLCCSDHCLMRTWWNQGNSQWAL